MSAGSDGMSIKVERLSTGYIRAQGDGPCEWAQWPEHHYPQPQDFFPEASATFRRDLISQLERERESGKGVREDG
jgi:hypothetical protein